LRWLASGFTLFFLPYAPIGAFGVIIALIVGKQIGIFGAVWALCRAGLAELPAGVSWRQLYGVALLGGIGFTMSLFIATLALGASSAEIDSAKLGIIIGSAGSAIAGLTVLATGRRVRTS